MRHTTTHHLNSYISLLRDAVPGITAADLDLPFCETGIHSLDSIILRDTVEGYFGIEIPDNQWFALKSLTEVLEHCEAKSTGSREAISGSSVTAERAYEIRLPQMANRGLSENWLLKEMGDMHWQMLGEGLGQKSSDFCDSMGNRLYAAFVRVNYSISPLSSFTENQHLSLSGSIKKFGGTSYFSAIKGCGGHQRLQANMMTSFSARKANDNAQISKGEPREKVSNIEDLPACPDFFVEHRLLKKGMTRAISSGGYVFHVSDKVIDTLQHTINPYYEINGVGLLYFAAFPLIADECLGSFMKNTMGISGFDAAYSTTYRDIFYFANCNAEDQVRVELNSIEQIEGNKLKVTTSLYRESDNKLMARVFTVKGVNG